MPSLMMKNKSNICCLREKNCLRVCQKSNMTDKRSCSHRKISQLAAETGLACQSSEDAFARSELHIQDTAADGAINSGGLLGDEGIQVKQLRMSSDDGTVVEAMVLQEPFVSCSTNIGTIFSPTVCQIDVHNVQNSYNAGAAVDEDSFCLSTVDESDGNNGSSSVHPTCNISDFYISDMVLAGLHFDGSSLCDDIAETLMFPEYNAADSNIFLDVMDQHLLLPFLGDSAESCDMAVVQTSEEARTDCDSSSFLLAIHQIRPGDQDTDLRPYFDSDESKYFDPHSFIKNLPDLSDLPNGQPTILPKQSQERKQITLVLDLDETLVHSSLEHCGDANFTFTVFFNLKEHTVYVKERPHLRTFLKKVAELFEIVVFTASQSVYAEQLLDILDPGRKLIAGRAYRESCIFSDGSYTKDLRVLGLDLAKVVIIDNSPQVFRLQVNNGIPIKSWFDDPSDNELISLIPFLETLIGADDVRPLIAKKFGNKE